MKCYKVCILLFFVLIFSRSYSQTPTISSDSVLIKLSIKTQDDKNLETAITFENVSTYKKKTYTSNKEGKVNCVLYTGESYLIKIPNSDDSYEYSIPDFSITPLELTFKFTLREKAHTSSGLIFFNDNPNLGDVISIPSTSLMEFDKISLSSPYFPL